MTSWIVTDAARWRTLPHTRQHEIRTWLRMNGISPADVPTDSAVVLVETEPGTWKIVHEKFQRSDTGAVIVNPKKPDEAYVCTCTVPLEIDPPHYWLEAA